MSKLITVIGSSGVGKTSLVHALSRTGQFAKERISYVT